MQTLNSDSARWVTYTPLGTDATANPLKRIVRDLRRARGMAWRLFLRDIRAQYRQSMLGYLWAFVPPIVLALSFTLAGSAQILNVSDTSLPYPLFAIISVVLWQTFTDAIYGPINGVKDSMKMLSKIAMPCEAIVLAKLGNTVFNLSIRLALIVIALWWYNVEPSWTMLGTFPAFAVLLIFGTAIGLILAPLGGLYDDVSFVLSLVLGLWFVLTPVMYEQAADNSLINLLNTINPASSLIATTRELLTSAPLTRGVGFLVVAPISILLLGLGWTSYRTSLSYVVERASA